MDMNQNYDFFICTIHKEDQIGMCVASPFTNNLCMVYRCAGIFGRYADKSFTELKSAFVTPLELAHKLENFTVLRIEDPLYGRQCSMVASPELSREEVNAAEESVKGALFVGGMPDKTKVLEKVPESALKDTETLREYLRNLVAQS